VSRPRAAPAPVAAPGTPVPFVNEYKLSDGSVLKDEFQLAPRQVEFFGKNARFVLFGGARGGGKEISLTTTVPTPSGWATVGDLRAGDLLFTEAGQQTRILELHPIDLEPEAYRLTFDDGSTIDACADHLWHTFTKADRSAFSKRTPEYRAARRDRRPSRAKATTSALRMSSLRAGNAARAAVLIKQPPLGAVRTTREIRDTLRVQHGREVNHSIRVADAIQLPDALLPVPPYILGAWLGDGSTAGAVMAIGAEDIEETRRLFLEEGFTLNSHQAAVSFGVPGLVRGLRQAGVLRNKHIPTPYLRASEEQRLALLQGLMDTDGTCSKDDGQSSFTNTNERIARGVYHLAATLGIKPFWREDRATLYGKDCGPCYTVTFTTTKPVFRLPRKVANLPMKERGLQRWRYIVGCDPIPPVPMRCITVDNPTGLFLIGENCIPTHNTGGLAQKMKSVMLSWPGIEILVLRKDLSDLKRTTMREFINVTPKEFLDPKYGGQWHRGENWIRYPNGSIAWFGEAKDWESYKGMNLGKIFVDEADEVDEAAIIDLQGALRWTTGRGVCDRKYCANLGPEYAREHSTHPMYQTIMACNPSPGWLKQRFYTPWKEGHERPDHCYVPATAFDNPWLPPSFIPDLMANNTATWVQNFIHGDWSAFENMVWPRWNRAVHRWRGDTPNRAMFSRIDGGIDYGGITEHAHATAAHLSGIVADGPYKGKTVTFWEYWERGAPSKEFFQAIAAAQRAWQVDGWDADSSQHRANQLLREGGTDGKAFKVPVHDSDRSKGAVKGGINVVHNMMKLNPDGTPDIYVTDDCPRLMSEIETYQNDPLTGMPKENQEDDAVNAWRYNVMRVSRYRIQPSVGDISVKTTPIGRQEAKPSGIITAMRAQRTERFREILEKMERENARGA